jgi:hypothetical protein
MPSQSARKLGSAWSWLCRVPASRDWLGRDAGVYKFKNGYNNNHSTSDEPLLSAQPVRDPCSADAPSTYRSVYFEGRGILSAWSGRDVVDIWLVAERNRLQNARIELRARAIGLCSDSEAKIRTTATIKRGTRALNCKTHPGHLRRVSVSVHSISCVCITNTDTYPRSRRCSAGVVNTAKIKRTHNTMRVRRFFSSFFSMSCPVYSCVVLEGWIEQKLYRRRKTSREYC